MDPIELNDRLSILETSVRSLAVLASRQKRTEKQPVKTVELGINLSGIVFLPSKFEVYNSASATDWVTAEVTEVVPFLASHVIVEAASVAAAGEQELLARITSGGVSLKLSGCAASGSCAGQAIVPVVRSVEKRTFDLKVLSAATANLIQVVGYFKINYAYGSDWQEGSTVVGTAGTGSSGAGGGGPIFIDPPGDR